MVIWTRVTIVISFINELRDGRFFTQLDSSIGSPAILHTFLSLLESGTPGILSAPLRLSATIHSLLRTASTCLHIQKERESSFFSWSKLSFGLFSSAVKYIQRGSGVAEDARRCGSRLRATGWSGEAGVTPPPRTSASRVLQSTARCISITPVTDSFRGDLEMSHPARCIRRRRRKNRLSAVQGRLTTRLC